MLAQTPIIAFIPTLDPTRARTFYEHTLGLSFLSDDTFALVFDANGTTIRIARVPAFTPFPFTLLGWHVPDIDAAVAALTARGVTFLRFPGLDQTPEGIWTAPGEKSAPGNPSDLKPPPRVAWFHDPDNNILSLSQH